MNDAGGGRSDEAGGAPSAAPVDEPVEFEYEGLYTHWVCPTCGHNDWTEGDTRDEPVECPACETKGVVAGG